MAKTLTFAGYSDDTFYCEGQGINVDKDTCGNGKPVRMVVTSAEGMMLVTGQYCPGTATGWQISIAPAHDDPDENPIPAWPMRIERSERPYSPALIIDAADDVEVRLA